MYVPRIAHSLFMFLFDEGADKLASDSDRELTSKRPGTDREQTWKYQGGRSL